MDFNKLKEMGLEYAEKGKNAAMDLAEKGHKVTVLCRQKSLASDAPHAHYVTMLEDAWLKLDNFYWVKPTTSQQVQHRVKKLFQ